MSTFPISVKSSYYKSSSKLYITAENEKDEIITAVKYMVIFYNAYGEPIKRYGYGTEEVFCTESNEIKVNNSFTSAWNVTGFSNVSKVEVIVFSVYFENGYEWGDRHSESSMIKTFGKSFFSKII